MEAEGEPAFQRQAQALGDQTRYRIFRYVADAAEPVRVAELTAHLGLNRTGIRQHLAKLCAAGLLVEEQALPTGPGRPARQYRLAPRAAAGWTGPGAYEELALVLLDIQRNGRSPRQAAASAGQRLASQPSNGDGVDRLEREMDRQGFQPSRVQRGSTTELVLGRCALGKAASVDPDIICEIHRGVAEGILEANGDGLQLSGLTRQEPHRGGCVLRVERPGG